jgi:hypothetical protein
MLHASSPMFTGLAGLTPFVFFMLRLRNIYILLICFLSNSAAKVIKLFETAICFFSVKPFLSVSLFFCHLEEDDAIS